MTCRCNQTAEEKIFDRDELAKRNEEFLTILRSFHAHRETPGDNPRTLQPELDVRYRQRHLEWSSGCSSPAGWDFD